MNTSFGDCSFTAAAPRTWNSLPDAVRNSALSENAFAKRLKTSDELHAGRRTFDVELAPLNKLILLLLFTNSFIASCCNNEHNMDVKGLDFSTHTVKKTVRKIDLYPPPAKRRSTLFIMASARVFRRMLSQ